MPASYTCLTCAGLPGVEVEPMGPDAADVHDDRGHDVRRLPDREERRGGPHGPPLRDPDGERDGLAGRVEGEVSVFRGERVGRRRGNY